MPKFFKKIIACWPQANNDKYNWKKITFVQVINNKKFTRLLLFPDCVGCQKLSKALIEIFFFLLSSLFLKMVYH
jgi:hypothetical protein